MPGDWDLGEIGRIQPNVVIGAMMVQHATVLAQMAFQIATTHENTLITRTLRQKAGATVSRALA
jgi:hypothetical protein